MPDYMLLLYQPDAEKGEGRLEDRWAEMPVWLEVTDSLRKAGLLVANAPLHSVATATTLRVRDGETELTDRCGTRLTDPARGPAGGAR